MCAYHVTAPRAVGSPVAAWLTWVGGGERHELHERHERSAHAVTGVVVLADVALTWLVTTLAVVQATHLSVFAVAPFTLAFALLVGAISRMAATGRVHGAAQRGVVAVGVILGAMAGEFASLAMLSSPIDQHLQRQATRNAALSPAVVQASGSLQQMRDARAALDRTVDVARTRRDEALIVARCEYHPTVSCPQTRITGVPGSGPETRTANQILADSQRELDEADAARDRRAPDLDARIVDDERLLSETRQGAIADADHGLGARWVAMQQLTSSSTSLVMLRLLSIAFFAFLALLPTILRLWRGETTHDRHARARAERERAELSADTAIAVKQAEVRAATETMWAEGQLAQARLAVEAQIEIDRAQLRQQVTAAIEATTPEPAPVVEDMYLPIAAEAEAASLAATQSIEAGATPAAVEAENLPAVVERSDTPATPTIPTIPDVTRAAARWIRPLVPGFVARAIDTTTHPLRTARQVIEEVEEITFSLKRTHRVTVHSQESTGTASTADAPDDTHHADFGAPAAEPFSPRRLSPERAEVRTLVSNPGEPLRELVERDGPRELRATDGPKQLPPAE
ncbi:DUF4407 domain-containing protein [Mycobacterium cookii]|uniref:Membrane protein n=1 Tax=Mycobacterium cookii TaxID=1775 RepID=A0A7I7KSV2_9MYCO|nr:DUF4407 domain-containing protein [Mycobacterium cookii]MCV7331213.1 DUF4407 domain-containing protein [Mycobacterium cookii]BBX44829.1 membrane protein [Mycobacterium cookii]